MKPETPKTKSPKSLVLIVVLIFGALILSYALTNSISLIQKSSNGISKSVAVKFVNSIISADGVVTAQAQATLTFQLPGKLVYLPFKEGSKVYQGQTIAQLDTYALKKQLQLAANAYQMSKNTTDQALENNQAGILEGQTRYSLDTTNKMAYSAVTEATVIYDTVQHIVQNDLLLNNSAQINVDLANYAVQLASLTSPINGIITHQGVTMAGINITPATSFTVADPDSMVFRANVPTQNIYYVAEGGAVTLAIDGIPKKLNGTIVKIYPAKVVLTSGQSVYQVDVACDDLKKQAKLDLAGTALISTNSENVALVPAWTVLSGKYIWIDNNGIPELRTVTSGKTHGNEIEIIKGLTPSDKIIVDPKFIPSHQYQLL
jgi:multidrug efflux pump subunit AcrA (membrane-fusion protein)